MVSLAKWIRKTVKKPGADIVSLDNPYFPPAADHGSRERHSFFFRATALTLLGSAIVYVAIWIVFSGCLGKMIASESHLRDAMMIRLPIYCMVYGSVFAAIAMVFVKSLRAIRTQITLLLLLYFTSCAVASLSMELNRVAFVGPGATLEQRKSVFFSLVELVPALSFFTTLSVFWVVSLLASIASRYRQ